jgi:hypothetical protein
VEHGKGDDTAHLRSINFDMVAWEQTRDAEAIGKLGELLSPQLVFRRADKSVVGRKEFIDGLSGPSPFTTRESSDVVVELRGDRAVSTSVVTTTKEDGSVNHYRNIRWFARAHGRWLVEYWFNDDVADLVELAAAWS